jgi:Family of unknown function (DUF6644)
MVRAFFQWMNDLPFSKALGASVWQFATIQALHLVFVAILAGALLIVDLRLMGVGVKDRPVSDVARDAHPWLIFALLALTVTGVPQMMQNATREYFSFFFWLKMAFLFAALVFTFTVRRRVTLADEARVAPVWAKTVGLVSIVLWAGVAIPARLIGLFS